jgi:nucleoside-diphosphate-sugar epimerase
VYNIAAGRPVSVRDLARVLAGILGVPDAVEARPPRPGDIRDSWADVSAARRDLGFAARVPLEEGLRRTAQALEP